MKPPVWGPSWKPLIGRPTKLSSNKIPWENSANEEIGRLRAGELFGERSLIDDLLTSARVTTVGHCQLLKLPRAAFEIEDPIEFVNEDKFSRITQREIGPDTPDFSKALRAALRYGPDVILGGERRDAETIEIAVKSMTTRPFFHSA
jgi:Tfp pilus assembly ATPase PilU